MGDPLAKKRGWHVKPLAALASSFEQVLVLDADALPLQPPERFFDHPVLQPPAGGSTGGGMLLFRDHVHCLTSVSAWLLTELKLTPEAFCEATGGQEIDSSAVVVDKSNPAVWKALHLAEALNRRWHKATFEYDQLLSGDKDTWLIAAMLSHPREQEIYRSPVSAHPPGFLVMAAADDAACPVGGPPGACAGVPGEVMQLREESQVVTLSWHCHFDHENAAPLYINSRQLHREHRRLLLPGKLTICIC